MGVKIDWEDLAFEHGFNGDDKAMLTQWRCVDLLTINKIASKLGVSGRTVHTYMRQLGIKDVRVPCATPNCAPRLPGWRK